MIEDIFLSYANYSLKDHPENLQKIFEEFKDSDIYFDRSTDASIKRIIGYFGTLAKCEKIQIAQDLRREMTFPRKREEMDFNIAFDGVFGYRNGYCERKCLDRTVKREVLGKKRFLGPGRLKCYECDQLYFRSLMDGIVEGLKYKDIGPCRDLETLILNAYGGLKKGIVIFAEKESTGKELKEVVFFLQDGYELGDRNFSQLILGQFVAFSLTEFLLHNDRRKLKKCPFCHNFFIATDIKRKKCYSDDCRKAYERDKKRKQRAEDIVKYY
jgi:hypothetical protein